jgi:hypothetical protein
MGMSLKRDEELWAERRAKLSKLRPVTEQLTFHLRISNRTEVEAEAEPHSQVLQSSKMSQVITNPFK